MNRAGLIAIFTLAVVNIFALGQFASSSNQIKQLKVAVDNKTSKVIVYRGEDGKTPLKNVDYFDGINAVSYVKTNTVTREKEMPPINGLTPPCYFETTQCRGAAGESIKGEPGENAPRQELRINPNTGALESKYEDETFWMVLLPCEKIQLQCGAI